MNVQERIQAELSEIERVENVRILYAVESGSRAWGFASEDSDYDVRFIYIRPLSEYVRVDSPRDVIELPLVDDLDINGWDILKAGTLFRKSNPPLLEWLFSPIVYRETGDLAARLRALAKVHASLRRMTYHYLNMARNDYQTAIANREQVVRKKYLYAMRPLICIRWMERFGEPAPTNFLEAIPRCELPAEVQSSLQDLIASKRQGGEMGSGAPLAVLENFIVNEVERVTTLVANLPDDYIEAAPVNQLLWAQWQTEAAPALPHEENPRA